MPEDPVARLENKISQIEERISKIERNLYAAFVLAVAFGLVGAWGLRTVSTIKADLDATESRLSSVQSEIDSALATARNQVAKAESEAVANIENTARDAVKNALLNHDGIISASSFVVIGSNNRRLIEIGQSERGDGHLVLYGDSGEAAVELETQNSAGRVAVMGPRGSVEADGGMAEGDPMPRLEVVGVAPECWNQSSCSSASSSIFRAYLEKNGSGSVGGFVDGEYWSAANR